jgi:hypothetical protein
MQKAGGVSGHSSFARPASNVHLVFTWVTPGVAGERFRLFS